MIYSSNLLNTPIEYLKGVGPQRGDWLRKELEILCYGDLLHYFPFRYIDKTKFTKINQALVVSEAVQIIARVHQIEIIGEGFKKRLVITVKDDTGEMDLIWFQGISWIQKFIYLADVIVLYGKVNAFNGVLSCTHPEVEKYDGNQKKLNKLDPVYSTTEKLKTRGVSSKVIQKMVEALLAQITTSDSKEVIPTNVLQQHQLISKYDALVKIHFPKSSIDIQESRYRLKFEELFLQQIGICKTKINISKLKGFVFEKVGDYFNTFYNFHLPFTLTDDQKNVIKEIRQNMITGCQMNRLLQGDVGSGKTMVALLVLLIALDNNFQTCLVAPTEILCQQHFESIKTSIEPLGIKINILTGTIKGKERKKILEQLADGSLQIIIGTHALFEDKVIFKNLGLAVIDEQHRFGVAQRAKLWAKNSIAPHILVMTATPIPRTLAMTMYGDLDVSTIFNLPPGRKPIQTVHRSHRQRASVMEFIKSEINLGRQAYIVYPLIEESEKMDYEDLMQGYEQVKQFFPDHSYRIAMVHGRQPAEIKETNMQRFISGDAQILVATTVIEVGVDVPNASTMLIESSERFGLSQLHQLRGRVGRGSDKSYCILMTGDKLSNDGKERIQTMITETNGFKISEKDLQLRGPGTLNGLKQSGASALRIADLVADVNILSEARENALQIINTDSSLELPIHSELKKYMLATTAAGWGKIS
jgi:ATP-dependent DNA helicase RecG